MPPLSNLRHEQFAQLVARGASATQAYGEAGYSTKSEQVAARVSGQVARLPLSIDSIAGLPGSVSSARTETVRKHTGAMQVTYCLG